MNYRHSCCGLSAGVSKELILTESAPSYCFTQALLETFLRPSPPHPKIARKIGECPGKKYQLTVRLLVDVTV